MKTLEELYNEVVANDELKAQLAKVADGEGLAAFAAANGVETTAEEALAFLEGKSRASELSPDELDAAAGGKDVNVKEAAHSAFTLGVSCAIVAIKSAVTGNVGTAIKEVKMLCDK